MSRKARLLPYAYYGLVAALYLAAVTLVTGGPGANDNPLDYWLSVLAGLLCVELLAFWILTGFRIGREMPPVGPSPAMRTRAQARRERHGTAALCAVIALTGGIAPAGGLLQGEQITWMHFAPLALWIWLLYALGFTRMRLAAISLLTHGRRVDTARPARLFLAGAALHLARDSTPAPELINIAVAPGSQGLVPCPDFLMLIMEPRLGTLAKSDDFLRHALMCHLTGDGDPYRLIGMDRDRFDLAPAALSAHERMAAGEAYRNGVATAERLAGRPA